MVIFVILTSLSVYADKNESCLNFHVIHSEPVGYLDSLGLPKGIHWDYLEAIKKHSGLCIKFELMPYARIWEEIKHGRHDGGIIFRSESRSSLVEYVGHIKTVPTVIIPVKGITLDNYSDLNGLIIGTMRGAHLSKKFDGDTSLNIVEVIDYEQEIRMINMGRIDAIAGNELILNYQLNKHDAHDNVNFEKKLILGEKQQWLQLSKNSQHLDKIPVLHQSIKALKENGTFNNILVKYYGTEDTNE